MARIPEDVIESIRQAVDLADLVGRYVPLKRAGKSWKGCCPFHQEKTPSFHVTPERGMWKCFGCGKGGNAFTFLMEKEGLSFPEAARQLARDVGVALAEDDDPAAAEQASRLTRLRDACEWACVLFQKALWAPEGEAARAYVKRRGITGETAKRFRLGYAPPGWQNLVEAARRTEVPESDLVEVGLLRRKEGEGGRPGRLYDMFRDRVIFPICDPQGRVVAFGARTLGDEEPKYLNSPETPLFSKGRTVYALNWAKQEMMSKGEGAVMEGYTDVIMAHQCGWPVAVAGLGTALTRDQASMIAKYVKRLYLVYDGDAAGLKAAEKNAPAFLPEEIETRVAMLSGGEDPCDLLLRAGLPALRARLDESREVFDHLLVAAKRTPGEAQGLDTALSPLVSVTGTARRTIYVRRVAEEFRISDQQALDRLAELSRVASTVRHASPAWASQVAESATAPPVARDVAPPQPIEEQFIEALLGWPELCVEAAERLPAAAISHPLCRELFDRLLAAYQESGAAPSIGGVLGAIEEPALASFAAGLVARGAGKDLEHLGRDCMARLAARQDAWRLRETQQWMSDPGESRRSMRPEEGETLRRDIELNRRRMAKR